jgi:hypothetical protein
MLTQSALPSALAAVLALAAPTSAEARPDDMRRHVERDFEFHVSSGGGGAALGVNVQDITTELREYFGAPSNAGVLVAKVTDDSAAAAGGIEVGDVIVAVQGVSIDTTWDLIRAVSNHEPEAEVQVDVVRGGRRNSLSVKLDERKGGKSWHGFRSMGPGPGMGSMGPGPGMGFPGLKHFENFRFEMPDFPSPRGLHGPRGPGAEQMHERLEELEERLKKLETKL